MAAPRLGLFVLVLACIALTEGLRGFSTKKCCYHFNDEHPPKSRVVSYVRTSQQCTNPGVKLRTEKNRVLCVRPSVTWVQNLIRDLDAKRVPGEKSNI
ncbi:hypothetical protein PAMP_019355 [Pampus punctatissimus]